VNRSLQRIIAKMGAAGAALLIAAVSACSSDPQAPPAEVRHYVALSVGPGHTCALTAEHEAWCWGNNADGKLGAGPAGAGDQLVPTRVAGGVAFAQISAGESPT
jgi:alpha-tubulin suppressor-like RCC1 family protein